MKEELALYINTAEAELMIIGLQQGADFLVKEEIKAPRQQSEKLLVAIDQLLVKNKFNLSELKKIIVKQTGSSFTSLRIGVLTANALAYALKIPVVAAEGNDKLLSSQLGIRIVKPIYQRKVSFDKSGTKETKK